MSMKGYVIFNIATGLLEGAVLAAIVLWLLPLWGVNIPMWGLILLMVVFVIYEVVTFRLGRRALERKSMIPPQVGCCGEATTPLTPYGYVQVEGELWRAVSSDMNINKGDDIVVVEVNRLTLSVAPLSGTMMGSSVKLDTESDYLLLLSKVVTTFRTPRVLPSVMTGRNNTIKTTSSSFFSEPRQPFPTSP